MTRTALPRRIVVGVAGVALAALAVTACSSGSDTPNSPGSTSSANAYQDLAGTLKASGSSFANNMYQKALDEFAKVAPNVDITYNSTGSGTGKKEFGSGITDFAGTDSLVKAGDGPADGSYVYVPTVAAPITVSYNLAGVSQLKLSGETLGKIFSRSIKTWNDPAIAADNQGVTLPSKPIVVVHRSDGSGTTSNFTKYLVAAGGSSWTLGAGDTVAWPADTQAGAQNAGVAQLVKQSDGAIGYVDFGDAKASGLVTAMIKNKDGQFVDATLDGCHGGSGRCSASPTTCTLQPAQRGGCVQPTRSPSPTYLLLRPSYTDAAKAKAVKGFVQVAPHRRPAVRG